MAENIYLLIITLYRVIDGFKKNNSYAACKRLTSEARMHIVKR